MKTKFKPYKGTTSMQIEAETDLERALLHATFGRYYYRDKNEDKRPHRGRLRLVREYQDGKVNKILVKMVEYISPNFLIEKGWQLYSNPEENPDVENPITYWKKEIGGGYLLLGIFTNNYFVIYKAYIKENNFGYGGINISSLGTMRENLRYMLQNNQELQNSADTAKTIFGEIIVLLQGYNKKNYRMKRHSVKTEEEYGEVIKKIIEP